jgi:hypothetical protein
MSSSSQVLIKMYSEELAYSRHHSSMRSNVTGLICAIGGAALALAGNDGLSRDDLPITLFNAFLGVFGVVFSLKQYERGHLHRTRAKKIRQALDAEFPAAGILSLRSEAGKDSERRHPVLRKIRHHSLWCSLNAAVFVLGAVASLSALG